MKFRREWLRKRADLNLSEEEKQQIEALGGWDKLMETLRKWLEEQRKAHHGGNKWIGTGGTSPFGAHGYNPEGIRIGQDGSGQRRAVKVWDRREYQDLGRHGRARHSQHKAGTTQVAQVRPRGRRGRTGHGRHHRLDGAQCGILGYQNGPGTPQCGEGAAIPGRRRFHERPRQDL